jgi:hypothetical protein
MTFPHSETSNFIIFYSVGMYLNKPTHRGSRGRYRMVVEITTTYAISAYHQDEVCSIQNFGIKFVSDLRQDDGFLRLPPPIKLIPTIK